MNSILVSYHICPTVNHVPRRASDKNEWKKEFRLCHPMVPFNPDYSNTYLASYKVKKKKKAMNGIYGLTYWVYWVIT